MVIKGPSSMVPLQKNKKEEEEMDEDESGSEENEDLGQDALEPGDTEDDDDASEGEDDEESDSGPANRPSKKGSKMLDDEAIEDNSPLLGDEDEDEDDEDDDDDDDESDDMEQDARLLLWNLPNDIKQNEIETLLKQSKLDIEEIRISNAPCAIVKLKNGVTGDFGELPEKKLRGQPLNLAIFLGEVEPAPEGGVSPAKVGKAAPAAQQPKGGKQPAAPAAAKTKAPTKQVAEEDEDDEDEDEDEEKEDDDEEEEEDGAPTPVSTKKPAPVSKAPAAPRATAGAGGKLTLVVTSIPFDTSMDDVKAFMQKQSPTNVFMPTRPDGRHKGLAKLDFATAEAAETARAALDGVEFNGRNLRAKMDDNKPQGGGGGGDRQQQRGNWPQKQQDSLGGPGGRFADPERGETRCLLVKGLPVDVRNDTVTQMFGGTQKVERVYTLTNSASKHGNAAAFVTFTTAEGAASAFDDFNGKQIDDCPVPLQIGFAREKGKEEGGGGGFRGGGRGGFRGGFRGGDRGGFGGGGRGFGGRGRGGFDRGGFGGGGRGGGRGFRGGGGGRGFGGGRGGGFGGGRGGFKRQSGEHDMSGSPNQKHLRFNGGGSDSD